jgi:hypothetical protein
LLANTTSIFGYCKNRFVIKDRQAEEVIIYGYENDYETQSILFVPGMGRRAHADIRQSAGG